MNRTAILRTIELTRELEARDARLDMNTWGDKDECGTVGCLGGWMTLDPELRAMGLGNADEKRLPSDRGLAPVFYEEGGYYVTGYAALAELFGISLSRATGVFGSWNPPSWSKARERLEGMLK